MFMVHDTVIFNTKLILFMHGIKYLYYFNFTHLIIFNTKFFIFPASNYNIYCHYHKYRINRSTVYTFFKIVSSYTSIFGHPVPRPYTLLLTACFSVAISYSTHPRDHISLQKICNNINYQNQYTKGVSL